MKVNPQCIPCILAAAYRVATTVSRDRIKRLRLMQLASMEIGRGLNPEVSPCQLSGQVLEALKKASGVEDPYRKLKIENDRAALKLLKNVERRISEVGNLYHRFRLATEYSVAANAADYGVFMGDFTYSGDLEEQLDKFLKKGLALDEIDLFYSYASQGGKLLYLLDNCGEMVFDSLLMRILKEMGCKVTAVVKGKPCLNDATLPEALEIGLDEIADMLISTGETTCGLGLQNMSSELERALKGSDLIISKGQANYEDLSEIEESLNGVIVYLLVAKCKLIAQDLGVDEVGASIVKCVT